MESFLLILRNVWSFKRQSVLNGHRDKEDPLKMNSYVYVGDYNFNLFAASLLRKGRSGKDYFYNTDQKHLTLKYQLNEIKNLNSLDELMSISYSKVIITSVNSSNLISALLGMGIFDFSVMNYRAYPASEKRSALEFSPGRDGRGKL